ncbi:MAG: M20/M25/M40 family metallo-hydrolase [Bacteroidetes bacterium]|nr:M20/M25/M40 family metallo-hydrolase [Bacteroidota bacterium]
MKKILLLCLLPFIGLAQTNKSVQASRNWINKNGPAIISSYAELLAMPNNAMDNVNIRKNAQYIQNMFATRGFAMQLLEVEGAPPVVYGEYKVLGATRTYCIYAHYDGQPVDPTTWKNEPFQPVLFDQAMYKGGKPIAFPKNGEAVNDNWRIYARSASDDKAPIIALMAAVDALKTAGLKYTSNIKLFFDGEEEAGSPHVGTFIKNYHTLFDDVTVWLLCDGPVFQTGDPTLKFGGRGVTDMELTVYGASRPLHSGHYGNYAPDPGFMLSQLLASMKDEKGNVIIDGYYSSVEPISAFERQQLARVPNIESTLKDDLALNYTEGSGQTLFERLLLPSLTVKGLYAGNVGALARNVIPNTAVASLSMRLVKGNDPEKMLDLVEAHIRKQGWHIVYEDPDHETRMKYPKIVKVDRDKHGFPAAKVSMDHPDILPVIESVKGFTGDKLVLLPSEGGSNHIFEVIFDEIKKPGISVNIVNHDNNQHAEDENVRIGNLWYGVDLMCVLLTMPQTGKVVKK